jgi:hypothetical protein
MSRERERERLGEVEPSKGNAARLTREGACTDARFSAVFIEILRNALDQQSVLLSQSQRLLTI